MVRCPKCDYATEEDICPACGCPIPAEPDEDTMDKMVAAASIPNLAALFKGAKARGLIGSTSNYAN